MTYKMLIVDDEPIISRGLQQTIPWETINVEVVDTAHDGEDAIQKITQYENIDIVITDVRMPKMDGLQLATYLHEHFRHIRTIIISGYNEFAYAQKAIRVGVKDYLLKPVDIDELIGKVEQFTHEINLEQRRKKEQFESGLQNAIIQQLSDLQEDHSAQLERYGHLPIFPFISMQPHYIKKIANLSPEEIDSFKNEWKSTIELGLQVDGYNSFSFFTEENILLTCIYGEAHLSIEIHNDKFDLQFVWNDTSIPIRELKQVYEKLVNQSKDLLLKGLDKQDLLIDQAQNYIREYYRTDIKVHEVADVINITPNYFSSLFKQKTGVNFNEYVNQLRVEEAKLLLAETPFKVNEISEQVGFHEYKYFVAVFKKITGMTPTDYRKFVKL
ncbi:response regulator transcription factor [Bacillus sp. REN16]|uniref:response regulator transcription factor n=1 Tax=Bacillus sp. REN16 TaxID=2887296 RepID=UPI001E58C4B9|nr:response regulator [Bacillus sp. REN16]MCC3356872.1 response regulator [Bacillus sp. REN16]